MSHLRAFLAFLYDFIVGDDPRIALTIAAAIAATAALTATGINAWWLLPPAAYAALARSLARATKPDAGSPTAAPPKPHAGISGPASRRSSDDPHPRAARSSL
jgi:hypothetical protein